jgi:hypothetical protein
LRAAAPQFEINERHLYQAWTEAQRQLTIVCMLHVKGDYDELYAKAVVTLRELEEGSGDGGKAIVEALARARLASEEPAAAVSCPRSVTGPFGADPLGRNVPVPACLQQPFTDGKGVTYPVSLVAAAAAGLMLPADGKKGNLGLGLCNASTASGGVMQHTRTPPGPSYGDAGLTWFRDSGRKLGGPIVAAAVELLVGQGLAARLGGAKSHIIQRLQLPDEDAALVQVRASRVVLPFFSRTHDPLCDRRNEPLTALSNCRTASATRRS